MRTFVGANSAPAIYNMDIEINNTDNIVKNTYQNMRLVGVAVGVLLFSGSVRAAWDVITLQEWLVTMEQTAIDDIGAALCGLAGVDRRVAVLRRAREAGADDAALEKLAGRYEQALNQRRQNEWAAKVARTPVFHDDNGLYPGGDCRRYDTSSSGP